MPSYTDVFGGANIYPSEISYSSVALSADITLSWPEETSTNVNLATRIMDVTPSGAGFSIILPDAKKSGTGNTILFNNKGSDIFTVKNAGGVQVGTIAAGQIWQVYLTDNTTTNGVWQILQYGATTSSANASALAGTGIVAVGTLLSQSVPITAFNSSYTAGNTDRARMYNWTGAGGVLTLPDPTAVGNNWFMYLRNSGSGQISVTPPGSTTIDGTSPLAFQPGESSIIASDGSNFYTIGFGQAATFAFDYTVIDVPGSGDFTLSGAQLNRVAYRFTGILTGARNIIIPATVQQYWIDNRTTGSFTFTVKVSGTTGVTLTTNERGIFYCDGSEILDADTATIGLPISIANGGTGATSAGAALINLGGTSTGIALFEAANQAAAWTALGVAQAGNVNGGTFT
ncbi:MAG: hypothetical protein ACKVKR_08245 [Pseudomonadales bacterium]|jgi:hypothetical protein|tara:strand:- start:182 stop:1384 length:1203 start_codon:yes stop_codon:yes gene_type:complete